MDEEGKPPDRNALVTATCRKQKDFVDRNIRQIKVLRNIHHQELENLQNPRKATQEERRKVILKTLVKQYNANLATFNKNASARKKHQTRLLGDAKRQLAAYNQRCPGRMYQETNGLWQRFSNIQLTFKND